MSQIETIPAFRYKNQIFLSKTQAELCKLSDEIDPLHLLYKERDALLRQRQIFKSKVLPVVFREYQSGLIGDFVISDMPYNPKFGITIHLTEGESHGWELYAESSTSNQPLDFKTAYSINFFRDSDEKYIRGVMKQLLKFKLKTYLDRYQALKLRLQVTNEKIADFKKQKEKMDKIV